MTGSITHRYCDVSEDSGFASLLVNLIIESHFQPKNTTPEVKTYSFFSPQMEHLPCSDLSSESLCYIFELPTVSLQCYKCHLMYKVCQVSFFHSGQTIA